MCGATTLSASIQDGNQKDMQPPNKSPNSLANYPLSIIRRTIKQLVFGDRAEAKRVRVGLLRGLYFHIDPKHKSQRLIGFDEREIVSITRRFASRARTCVDIGAYDGWYTVYCASMANVERVFACEPSNGSIELLHANLSLNKNALNAKVTIIPRFIGTKIGHDWISVDDLLETSSGPFLLKVDVDGGELDVLQSAEKTLKVHAAYLIVETHSPELERDCVQFLSRFGYSSRVVKNAWYRWVIPDKRPIPHNRWFYAEKL
jgi:precorrin-6B methylase 2